MFTGIVEDLGEVEAVEHLGDSARLVIRSAKVTEDARPGDSIAVNGVCLTVTGLTDGPLGTQSHPSAGPRDTAPRPARGFTADVMGETLKRSSLAAIAPGAKVNLERSVRAEDRLGGHLVQGHVDGVGEVTRAAPELEIRAPEAVRPYLVEKGSVTVDGVSLTVVAVTPEGFTVAVIPHTMAVTTLGRRRPGDRVNLEVDVIAKYAERLLAAGTASPYRELAETGEG